MIVQQYEHQHLQYYTGFNAGYINDDFIFNRVTIKKVFTTLKAKYMILYTTGSGILHIRKYENGYSKETAISIDCLKDTWSGVFPLLLKDIVDCDLKNDYINSNK